MFLKRISSSISSSMVKQQRHHVLKYNNKTICSSSNTNNNYATSNNKFFKPRRTFMTLGSGESVITRVVKEAKTDPGKIIMNFGAIASLTGFMMTDVMYLRSLSVVGSACGITYNLTRKPKQINAVLWGLVFAGVNVYQLYQLYLERSEKITYTHDEMLLYTAHFKDWGVDPRQFKKLVDSEGCTFQYIEKGQTIVEPNNPLNDVILIHRGEAAAEDPLSKEILYTYRGDGCNGCVIGGTALVDNTVRLKAYPNRIVAATDSTIVKWNTDHLANVMHEDKEIESAVLHALYVELIQGLRRERRHKHEKEIHANIVDKLEKLDSMIEKAIATYNEKTTRSMLLPTDKKNVREFILKNRITIAQKENILNKFGWTMDNWEDGSLL